MSKLLLSAASLLAGGAIAFSLQQPPAQPAPKPVQKSPIRWEGSVFTALEVKDLAASKTWYAEVLGCEVFYELAEFGWCELKTPVERSLLALSQVEPGKAPAGTAGAYVSFGTLDVEAARKWLVEKGVQVGEIVEIPETVKLLHFADPDGNRLMLYQPAGG
jgi:predicted enzyme related to lactoylglutathione lyase